MAENISAELFALSRLASEEFFMRPDSYAAFDLTSDRQRVVGCVDPRDPAYSERGKYKTIIQTAGGSLGEGLDQALANYASDSRRMTVAEGMAQNVEARPFTVFEAHHDCRFGQGLSAVTAEMAGPGDFTAESVAGWAYHFNEHDLVENTIGRVMDAASVQLELLERTGHDDLLPVADRLFPNHNNVYEVRSPALARVYVMNLHPYLGQNRNRKPSDSAAALSIQAYHDSLAATVYDLENARRLSKAMRGLRVTAALLRAAATRSVITQDKMSDMTFLDIVPDNSPTGLAVNLRKY